MDRRADLSPPLGKPGGPCQVIKRIDDKVRNPGLKQDLVKEVMDGEDLSNADASKVYPVDSESGVGPIKQLRITSHGQYRMDLRSITVDDVRKCIASFLTQLDNWKKLRSPAYETFQSKLDTGDKVEWVDPRTKLKIVFTHHNGVATLVSTFWKGVPDPGPTDSCRRVAQRYDRAVALRVASRFNRRS